MALMYDQARFTVKFNKLCSFMEDEIRHMKDILDPHSPPTPRIFLRVEDALALQKGLSHKGLSASIAEESPIPAPKKKKSFVEQATSILPSAVRPADGKLNTYWW